MDRNNVTCLTERQREILALVDLAGRAMALREVLAALGLQTNKRQLREDLATLRAQGLVTYLRGVVGDRAGNASETVGWPNLGVSLFRTDSSLCPKVFDIRGSGSLAP